MLRDINGRPIEQPAMVAELDYGWLAVDTSGPKISAVLQLEIETPYQELRASDLTALGIRFGSSRPLESALVRLDEPRCSPRLSPRLACRGIDDKRRCEAMNAPEALCRYVLRAQFFLENLPDRSDSVALIIGNSTQRMVWRR